MGCLWTSVSKTFNARDFKTSSVVQVDDVNKPPLSFVKNVVGGLWTNNTKIKPLETSFWQRTKTKDSTAVTILLICNVFVLAVSNVNHTIHRENNYFHFLLVNCDEINNWIELKWMETIPTDYSRQSL